MTDIILASGSKTRAKMLADVGVNFSAMIAPVDEGALKVSMIADKISAYDIADALADMKARSVSIVKPDAFVVGADQLLVHDGQILSKASDRASAFETLHTLAGGTHTLISAAVVYQNSEPVWRMAEKATLTMRPLSTDFINGYLDKLGDDAFWSVGSYQIEGLGAQLFTKVDGSHFTVLGLPLLPLLDFFRRAGCMPL